MAGAIGLAALIVVLAVFMPRVLDAIEAFLLAFFKVASDFLHDLQRMGSVQI